MSRAAGYDPTTATNCSRSVLRASIDELTDFSASVGLVDVAPRRSVLVPHGRLRVTGGRVPGRQAGSGRAGCGSRPKAAPPLAILPSPRGRGLVQPACPERPTA